MTTSGPGCSCYPDVPRRTVYAHTGWRQVADQWLYLHAGGAIGRVGRVTGIEICLADALSRFDLPDPLAGEDLRAAIRASLRLLHLAPRRISYPLYASISYLNRLRETMKEAQWAKDQEAQAFLREAETLPQPQAKP